MIPLEVHRAANRARFARLVARPDEDIDLALGALLIAADGRPELDFGPSLLALDALAERALLRLDLGDSTATRLDILHAVLYRELRFRAPTPGEYGRPANSRLDEVLERRVGLPISLAIIELEVAWRVGLALHGVGMPGHFLVGSPDGRIVDPADAGRAVDADDCARLLRGALGSDVPFHRTMLRAVGRRQILARVLRNLRVAHLAHRDWPAALGAVELLGVIEPTDPDHARDRGLLVGRMGRFSEAISLLVGYLDERPDAGDAGDVRRVIGIFRGQRN